MTEFQYEKATSNLVGETAIVIGAGMAGLLAAAALYNSFTEVVVIERDTLPPEPALRKGVPQGAHVHTFLGYAVEAFEELLPGVMNNLYDAGAVKIRRNYDIWFHDASGPTPVRDVGILTPSVTRPLLEHVTRSRLLTLENIRFEDTTRVTGFLTSEDGRVSGITVKRHNGEVEELAADLVVDCSGRGSRLPKWLEEKDYGPVPEQVLEIAMSYTSGLFRPPAELRGDKWACLMLAIPPALRAAYLTPVDGELWLATMYGRAGDTAPRDHEGFVEWTRGLSHPCIHERLVQAEPVSRLRSYNIPKGIWRRFDQMKHFPAGVLPMGENFTAFNPMYGQGISLAAGQALALGEALKTNGNSGLDREFTASFFKGCKEINQTGWSVMETRDLAYPSTNGERPIDLEERWQDAAAIRCLAEEDPEIHTLSVKVTHLLEPPDILKQPSVLKRAYVALGTT